MTLNMTGAGPLGKAIIERDTASLSPSYTRDYPLVIDRAQGSEVWDVDGQRYIDFMAGVAVHNVGHRHPHVVQEVQKQLDKYWHICMSDFYDPNAVLLGQKLQSIAPMDNTLVYYGNSGTEAVEAAIKLAMHHTNRSKYIGFLGGFHGRTLGSLSFTASKTVQHARYHAAVQVHHVPYPDPYRPTFVSPSGNGQGEAVIDYLENQLFRTALAPDDVAGVLVEPIQGEGGYVVPPPGFLPRLRELCDKHGIILIADEVQSGAGRCGNWWAMEHEGVEPDIVCFAKGIGSGFPIGGIIARKEIMSWGPGAHGSTFGGNPLAAAAAIATLDVIEQEGLLERARQTGNYIMDALAEMQPRHPSMGDVRGRGLMIGVELVRDKETKERAAGLRRALVQRSFELGLLILPCGLNTARLIPALNVPRELVDEGLAIFEQALSEVEKEYL